MSEAIVVRGTYQNGVFIPSEPLPAVDGAAELVVFPHEKSALTPQPTSSFDLFGKVPVLRSAEDIEAQIRDEGEAWGDE